MNLRLSPLTEAPSQAVEALLDQAFGSDRRGRTAYRLREGAEPIAELSFAAWDAGRLVGTLQSWPVALRTDDGVELLAMIGPVAVLPEAQGAGIGTTLMNALIAAADAEGADALMMIGDPPYYGRWGFTAERTGGWRIEAGPFEQHRLLARLRRTIPLSGVLLPLDSHSGERGHPLAIARAH